MTFTNHFRYYKVRNLSRVNISRNTVYIVLSSRFFVLNVMTIFFFLSYVLTWCSPTIVFGPLLFVVYTTLLIISIFFTFSLNHDFMQMIHNFFIHDPRVADSLLHANLAKLNLSTVLSYQTCSIMAAVDVKQYIGNTLLYCAVKF